jgi:hypothetical protein
MTEADWNSCTDLRTLLDFLRDSGKASERKMQLFVAACARSLLPVFGDKQEVVAVVYERYADGQASEADLIRCLTGELFDRLYPDGVIPPTHKLQAVWDTARIAGETATDFTHRDSRGNTDEEKARICNLLRDLFGPLPFRTPAFDPGWLAWNDECVKKLATTTYDGREFTSERMGVLADALEEAGCSNEELLHHLRQQDQVHCRGCWGIDLLLKKP